MAKKSPRICALCLNERMLCKSHIIPEFMYKTLYDEEHKILMVSAHSEVKNKDIQKGVWDYLLCADCETKFSQWENYVYQVYKGGVPLTVVEAVQGRGVTLDDVDYTKFKLFQLSILWRAHLSKHDFFSAVDLGLRHSEIIRQHLLAGNPGSTKDYGCMMCCLVEDEVVTDLIGQASRVRLKGITCYRFIFGGFLWAYPVSSHTPQIFHEYFLQESGRLVYAIKKLSDLKTLRAFAERAFQLGRLND